MRRQHGADLLHRDRRASTANAEFRRSLNVSRRRRRHMHSSLWLLATTLKFSTRLSYATYSMTSKNSTSAKAYTTRLQYSSPAKRTLAVTCTPQSAQIRWDESLLRFDESSRYGPLSSIPLSCEVVFGLYYYKSMVRWNRTAHGESTENVTLAYDWILIRCLSHCFVRSNK